MEQDRQILGDEGTIYQRVFYSDPGSDRRENLTNEEVVERFFPYLSPVNAGLVVAGYLEEVGVTTQVVTDENYLVLAGWFLDDCVVTSNDTTRDVHISHHLLESHSLVHAATKSFSLARYLNNQRKAMRL